MSTLTRRGRVIWFNAARGYGFIRLDDGTASAFVHRSAVSGGPDRTLKDGQAVVFEIVNTPKGYAAVNVRGGR